MTKTAHGNILTHLASETTSTCIAVKIKWVDGITIYTYTDHDEDVVFNADDGDGSLIYESSIGIVPTDIMTRTDIAVDNLELTGPLDSTGLNKADILSGKWDGADVTIYYVNYNSVSEWLHLGTAKIGKCTVRDNNYLVEIRSLAQYLQSEIGDLYSSTCRAKLGDSECSPLGTEAIPVDYTEHGIVLAVDTDDGNVRFACDIISIKKAASNWEEVNSTWFTAGLLTWDKDIADDLGWAVPNTDQFNDKLQREVRFYEYNTWAALGAGEFSIVNLVMPMENQVQVGDKFTIYAGCRKILVDCGTAKFNNVINFQGEPYVPGPDWLRGHYPKPKSSGSE